MISSEKAVASLRTIDRYVMGFRAHKHTLELGWPYGDTHTVVEPEGSCHQREIASSSTRAISRRYLTLTRLLDIEVSG